MLAVGVSLIGAGLAYATKPGGIFVMGTTGGPVPIDPQVSYVSTTWWLEYATAAKLYNYPDKPAPAGTELVPEVASRFAVSRDGRTYTFWIRKGFRFSDGAPVTAKNFTYALRRVLNRKVYSPGRQFITDPNGIYVAGYSARGAKLTIRLRQADSRLMSVLAMPFFQATSTKLPLDREATEPYPSAGPYAFTRHDQGVTSIRRNRYWKRGFGRERPRHLTGLDVLWDMNDNSPLQIDEMLVPYDEADTFAARFGVNRARFWLEPIQCVGFLAFNNRRGIFRHNPALRKAVSWAVDRTAYAAVGSAYSGSPWTHLLPPVTPGSVLAPKKQPYSVLPNLARAKKLASGHLGNGHVRVGYSGSGAIRPAQASIIRDDLIRLGLTPENVTIADYYREICDPFADDSCGRQDWDIAVTLGWCSEYPDPETFLDLILAPGFWGTPSWAPEDPKYLRRLTAAKQLDGAARLRAFGKLDLDLVRDSAPVVAMRTYNNLFLFSSRVDPRSLVYQPAYTDWSIPALALK